MKLRKINRGIALSCVVVVATSCYIVYDKKQFSKNVGNISQSVKDYLEDITDAQTSSDDPKQLCENLKIVIDKYMTYETLNISDTVTLGSPNKKEIISQLNSAPEDYAPCNGKFTKYEIKINDIKVSKYGNNGAVANVSYQTVSEFIGNPIDFTDSYVSTAQGNMGEDPEEIDLKQKYRQTKDCDEGEIYFNNIDGEWKICAVNTWASVDTNPITSEKTEQNGGVDNG